MKYIKVDEEERKAILEMVKEDIKIGLVEPAYRYLGIDMEDTEYPYQEAIWYTQHVKNVVNLACNYYIDLETKEVYKRNNI